MVNLVLPSNHPTSTKAVVLIYGWLGSQPKHIMKYANLYTERECAVIYDIAPVMALMTKFDKPLDKIVLKTVKKACDLIRFVEKDIGSGSTKNSRTSSEEEAPRRQKVPVIIHYFSNGGAFVAERLGFLIQSAENYSFHQKKTGLERPKSTHRKPKYVDQSAVSDLLFLSYRLKDIGFEISDSAPAYLYREASFNALETGVSNAAVKGLFKCLLVLFYDGRRLWNNCRKQDQEEVKFWKSMIQNDLCSRQAFIYSVNDKMTNSVKVDEFIEERKGRGVQVFCLKFDDSDHVLHLRKYPDEYKSFIKQIWQEVYSIRT